MRLDKLSAAEQQEWIGCNPVKFGSNHCGIEFDIWQVEALEAMSDVIKAYYNKKHGEDRYKILRNKELKTKFTIRAMHGPGKTFFAAFVILWFHTAFRGLSPATAPTLKQLKNRLWPNVRKIRARSNQFLKKMVEVRTEDIIWCGDPDWKVVAETGAQPENLQGYHDEFMLIVCDEASGIKEEMFPVVEGAMSTGLIVLMLMIGNPTKNIGTFADSHLKPKVAKNYYQIHVDLDKTTRVSRKWVQEMVDKYGRDSPVVKVRCFGDFAEMDEGQLMSIDWLDYARVQEATPDGSFPVKRLSADVADGGNNYTVLTLGEQFDSFHHLVKQRQYSFPAGRSVTDTVNEIKRWWTHYKMRKENGDAIIVDSLGVGAGVCSALVSDGYPVVRYIGGSQSDNSKLYRNRRVQSYMVARDHFREEKIVFADDFVEESDWDDLYAQLCSIRIKVGIEKVEDLLTKKEMQEAGIVSPDRADSIAMQFCNQRPMMGSLSIEDVLIGQPLESYHYDAALS